MKSRLCLLLAVLLAGCAETPMEYRTLTSPIRQPAKGGAYKTVDGMRVFLDGAAPDRPFAIIGNVMIKNRGVSPEGGLDRVVKMARSNGADAVVLAEAFARPTGVQGNAVSYGVSTSATMGQTFITDAKWLAVKYQ